MIKREIDISVTLTVEEIAAEFIDMDEFQMSVFFNEVSRLSSMWGKPFCFQLQGLTDCQLLSDGGRRIMEQIGEYSAKSKY
jgi:hypothetical protein